MKCRCINRLMVHSYPYWDLHSGQTHDACPVHAIILQRKIQSNVESFTLTAKLNAISENLSFLRWVCVGNEVIGIHKFYRRLVYRVIWCIVFIRTSRSYKSELIQSSRLWKTRSDVVFLRLTAVKLGPSSSKVVTLTNHITQSGLKAYVPSSAGKHVRSSQY